MGNIFAPQLAPQWGALSGYVATGTARGAFVGLVGGVVGSAIGEVGRMAAESATGAFAGMAAQAGLRLARGALTASGGGSMAGHEFAAAGASAAFGGVGGHWSGSDAWARTQTSMAGAGVGAGYSELTGGKFTNGADSASGEYSLDADGSSNVTEDRGYTTSSGVVVTYGTNSSTGEHRYRIRVMICSMATPGCNESYADRVFAHVNRNDIPLIDNDLGTGPRELLPSLFGVFRLGTQPIDHSEFIDYRVSINETRPSHMFHPGTVRHAVFFDEHGLYYEVLGVGSGADPNFNNFAGILLFRPGVEEVVDLFGR